mmetsp:Transcript_27986/g.51696  ORF Transcript_27986/g.51696 Transcript_27986/m.51696 type:complete len:844 (-) Transcript_27986:104-2635(-)|eukprot:CAMPEP_0175067280 /NCGR_PEP_ID=MMETSP0052_2-20121109/17007_1 /TAXON_ID=51329 ORGANISM="Polytomella parva, Strain SAG 63-3" /NCGR_SAMPLE_ID=MMETSP0052_2 /ASSEMBLY_ACC=CAM_ASM_000194 /LENGTH=843 /DNA_ID=CAMNT_0016334137 /DNA_START=142 /DNA_END=2673 /DNA_ORIENTATION=-
MKDRLSLHRKSASDTFAWAASPFILQNNVNSSAEAVGLNSDWTTEERIFNEQKLKLNFLGKEGAPKPDTNPRHSPGTVLPKTIEEKQNLWYLRTRSNALDPSQLDPKRAKRIIANRQSAHRSRMKKMQQMCELEQGVSSMQTQLTKMAEVVKQVGSQRKEQIKVMKATRQQILDISSEIDRQEQLQLKLEQQMALMKHKCLSQSLIGVSGSVSADDSLININLDSFNHSFQSDDGSGSFMGIKEELLDNANASHKMINNSRNNSPKSLLNNHESPNDRIVNNPQHPWRSLTSPPLNYPYLSSNVSFLNSPTLSPNTANAQNLFIQQQEQYRQQQLDGLSDLKGNVYYPNLNKIFTDPQQQINSLASITGNTTCNPYNYSSSNANVPNINSPSLPGGGVIMPGFGISNPLSIAAFSGGGGGGSSSMVEPLVLAASPPLPSALSLPTIRALHPRLSSSSGQAPTRNSLTGSLIGNESVVASAAYGGINTCPPNGNMPHATMNPTSMTNSSMMNTSNVGNKYALQNHLQSPLLSYNCTGIQEGGHNKSNDVNNHIHADLGVPNHLSVSNLDKSNKNSCAINHPVNSNHVFNSNSSVSPRSPSQMDVWPTSFHNINNMSHPSNSPSSMLRPITQQSPTQPYLAQQQHQLQSQQHQLLILKRPQQQCAAAVPDRVNNDRMSIANASSNFTLFNPLQPGVNSNIIIDDEVGNRINPNPTNVLVSPTMVTPNDLAINCSYDNSSVDKMHPSANISPIHLHHISELAQNEQHPLTSPLSLSDSYHSRFRTAISPNVVSPSPMSSPASVGTVNSPGNYSSNGSCHSPSGVNLHPTLINTAQKFQYIGSGIGI